MEDSQYEIQFKLDERGDGAFFIEEDNEKLAEMVIRISGNDLVVFHTEVSDKLAGKGVSKLLLADMVEYAREENLKVVPLCKFVDMQFRRHPEQYEDIWKKRED